MMFSIIRPLFRAQILINFSFLLDRLFPDNACGFKKPLKEDLLTDGQWQFKAGVKDDGKGKGSKKTHNDYDNLVEERTVDNLKME